MLAFSAREGTQTTRRRDVWLVAVEELPPMKVPRKTQVSIVGHGDAAAREATLYANGLTCGALEPLLAKHLRALAPGQILEVQSDRKEAADGIHAWARLTGNTLVDVAAGVGARQARYFVRKKMPQR
jgi:TusA-related sulfurtransferase